MLISTRLYRRVVIESDPAERLERVAAIARCVSVAARDPKSDALLFGAGILRDCKHRKRSLLQSGVNCSPAQGRSFRFILSEVPKGNAFSRRRVDIPCPTSIVEAMNVILDATVALPHGVNSKNAK